MMLQLQGELGRAIERYKSAFVAVALLSACLNILLLGGSIYMMMVYDSVLPSHSLATLFGLFAMLVTVYGFQGMFEIQRGRILSSVATGLDRAVSMRIQRAVSEMQLMQGRSPGDGLMAMRDLDNVRTFLSGSGPAALIDLPWILFFLVVLTLLHYWLGLTALMGSLVLVVLTVLNDRNTRKSSNNLAELTSRRNGLAESNLRNAEAIRGLGMRETMIARWDLLNRHLLGQQDIAVRSANVFGGITRVMRQGLQSLILTVGALLVIDGDASGGIIFASSVLFGRALAPVDQAIANWKGLSAAREGWKRLNTILQQYGDQRTPSVRLPVPNAMLTVNHLVLGPPGSDKPTVQGVNFSLSAGDALAVIGPSGSGKTSLARALVGAWLPMRGDLRLDGFCYDQWHEERFGQLFGYLPQTVGLLDGTIAENIARFQERAPSEAIRKAARSAGVEDLISRLPKGFDTPVGPEGQFLSAGQRQRIGLARALYGDPFVVVMDEPNSNLDEAGEASLLSAMSSVRARGGIVIAITHRPSLLEMTNKVLFIADGKMVRFGSREAVLNSVVHNAPRFAATSTSASVTG